MRDAFLAVVVASAFVLAGRVGTTGDATSTPTPTPPESTTARTTATPTPPESATASPSPTPATTSPAECARLVDDASPADATADANGTLLSAADLYARIGTADCADDRLALYYVAENGTWFHARPNGSVGDPAPEGNHSAVAPVRFHLDPDRRPTYVWRRYRGDDVGDCPYTQFYGAESGAFLGSIPVPCPTPTPASTPDG